MEPLGLCVELHNKQDCLPHPGQSPGVTPKSPPETTTSGGELGVGEHPSVCQVLCRTSGGAAGASPLPGHLPGLDLLLLLGPLPCHPHGHLQGKLLPLEPDQQVGQHQPQKCHMHTGSRAIAGMCPQPCRLASCCPLCSTYSELSSGIQLLASCSPALACGHP